MTTAAAPNCPGARAMLPALTVAPLLRAVAVHAVRDDQPWRTACRCGRALWPDAVGPSGRCAGCGQQPGAPPYNVEAAVLLAAGLIVSGSTGWVLAADTWWAARLAVLAFADLAVLRLPHRLTAATTAGLLGLLAATGNANAWWRTVTARLVLVALLAVLAFASGGQLGWADVAIAVPVAAALGWHSWSAVYAGTLLGLGAAALTAIILRRTGHLTGTCPSASS
ncbi:prepilin peptidase [Catellatospora citrea]|uniref:Leader peptidase (Prepilin peptidase)/N-methyltransferase n=1 Tax=Catellatospora citrea TaxID=53366 RepID=A0A8J3KM15_9ACTN|nr:prepilin peptidase [Catellatospora citrea]RKE07950.1 leader peptidase (prepilin peptidase)/N-methyltransferase [Catellatospora citrea]GIF98329.1 hypothetical protein Cci01nite_34230 [Catellatospora citrea]